MYIVHEKILKKRHIHYSIQGGAIKMKMSNLGSSHVIAFDLVNSKNRGLQKENMQLRPKVGFRERLKQMEI